MEPYGRLFFFFFIHQLLWCSGVTPNFPPTQQKGPKHSNSVISCQVFVALDGWAGIRFPPKTGLLEKVAVAVVPPHSEFTITAASPMFAMHLGQVSLTWIFAMVFHWLFYASFGFFWGGDFVGISFLLGIFGFDWTYAVFYVSIWEHYSSLTRNGGSQTCFDSIWGWSWHDPGWWTIM